MKCEGEMNDHMLHYEQMFLRGGKVNVVQY